MLINTANIKLNIIVALPCEARLLIDYYRLKKIQQSSAFSVFTNYDETIHLIISGIGKIKAAAATTYLHLLTGNCTHSTYLNLGIAGSHKYAVSDLVVANKITEQSTNKSWYPSTFLIHATHQDQLVTYDILQEKYMVPMMDMEAAGFFQAVSLLVSQEQAHVIKIISDVNEQSRQKINRTQVMGLIRKNIEMIDEIISDLLSLSAAEYCPDNTSEWVEVFKQRWHFTVYETYQLREILRRWAVYNKDINPLKICEDMCLPRQVLQQLTQKLDAFLAPENAGVTKQS